MDISISQIAQLLNRYIKATNSQAPLDLVPGKVIQATLLNKISNSLAYIKVGDELLTAKLTTDAAIGDKLALLITGQVQDGAVELKLIGKLLPDTAQSTGNDLPALLKTWNLQPSLQNIDLLEKIQSLGIPLDKEIFTALSTLQTGPQLHVLLQEVAGRIASLNPEQSVMLLPETTQRLTALLNVIKELLSSNNTPLQLQDKEKIIGLDFEHKAAQMLRASQNGLAVENEVASSLNGLLLATQADWAELDKAGLHQLSGGLATLLHHVTGQQLMQIPGQAEHLIYRYLALPIGFSGTQTAELHISSRQKGKSKRIDPSNCYILFHLALPHLGELDIHLHIINRVIDLKFVTKEIENLSGFNQQEFGEVLSNSGYTLGRVHTEQKMDQGLKPLDIASEMISNGSVNVQV